MDEERRFTEVGGILMINYREKAIDCVKDTVLPIQQAQFEKCGCNYDEMIMKCGVTESLFSRIIEPGHIYEVGYPKCVCGDVISGKVKDPAHCDCSRNSVLYILETLMPDKKITVETLHTVLSGAENCRFKVTVE